MKILAFDTETTGLVDNRIIKVDKLPSVIDFYGCLVDLKSGEIIEEVEQLIRPPQPLSDKPVPGSKKTITQITGLTNEVLADQPSFKDVIPNIRSFIECAPIIVAHNLSFDKEMLDIELQRLNMTPMVWPHGICTVEQTVHLKGYRMSLSDLHEYLFGIKFADAHRAKPDTQALVRCCVELHQRDIL